MSVTGLNTALGRIREKIALSRIVGQDVVLRRKGREFVGNCPFHDEKTGSFFVNDEKGSFYCFGCGVSGDVFKYMMLKYGLRFMQAAERLAEMAGVKLPAGYEPTKLGSLPNVLSEIVKFFVFSLTNHNDAQSYCKSRGIDKAVLEKFAIGFAPLDGKMLAKHLKIIGFTEGDIMQTSIFSKSNDALVCRFKNRLMFPIFNRYGHPIAFAGRSLHKNVVPKYLNSPETDLFQKKEVLYAYDVAIKGVSSSDPIIVVEGYMDTIMMYQHGFTTTVASMGTSLTGDQLERIWRNSDTPIICMDGDKAGHASMERTAFLALQHLLPGKSLKFCKLPRSEDPDSFLQHYGAERMQMMLAKSVTLVDFLWDCFLGDFEKVSPKTPENIASWKNGVFARIDRVKNADIRMLYRREMTSRIREIFKIKQKSYAFPKKPLGAALEVDIGEKMLLREAVLLYILIVRQSVISLIIEELATIKFSNGMCQRLSDCIIEAGAAGWSITDRCVEEVGFVSSLAGRYCDLSNLDDDGVMALWRSVYEHGILRKLQIKDVESAKKECSAKLSDKTWTRLKALKIEQLRRNKKPE
ncbi:MAG: DNA primase [Holosporales bacterium]|jgi:DNA primase|nr:DNA primase [Holosporales bacterium]